MNKFEVVETHIPSYDDSSYYSTGGYSDGHVIVCVTVEGKSQHFKIPAYENSDGYITYEFQKATPVKKVEKSVTVWR